MGDSGNHWHHPVGFGGHGPWQGLHHVHGGIGFPSGMIPVWGLVHGHWYQGHMSVHLDGSVHLDPSAAHIGVLTQENFVAHVGTHWVRVDVHHKHDDYGAPEGTWATQRAIGNWSVPDAHSLWHPVSLPALHSDLSNLYEGVDDDAPALDDDYDDAVDDEME